MVLVSVITPSYNSSDTIWRAIESVSSQTYSNIEHIIIDDGSSDNSIKVINEHQHGELRLLRFDENRGANAARNEGIRAAEGELVSFLDADDVLHPEYIEHIVEIFSTLEKEYAGVASSYTLVSSDEEIINYTPNQSLTKESFIHGNPIGSFSATTFHRNIFEEIGYLDEDLPAGQDYDFYLRVTDAGYNIYGLSDVLVTKYDRENNISSDINRKRQAFQQLVDKHANLLSSKRLATQHNMLGLISAETGDLDTAAQEFRAAIKHDPSRPLYYYHYLASCTPNWLYENMILYKKKMNKTLYQLRT